MKRDCDVLGGSAAFMVLPAALPRRKILKAMHMVLHALDTVGKKAKEIGGIIF